MPKLQKNGVEPPHRKDLEVQLEEHDEEEDLPGDEDRDESPRDRRWKPLRPQHSDN